MRRAITTAVAVVSVTGLVVCTGASAAPSGARHRSTASLVLSAARTASALVRVREPIHAGSPFDGLSLSTRGTFAGFLISARDGTPLLGRLFVRGVGLGPSESIPLWHTGGADVTPGTYRITVIADAPTVLRIPLDGARGQAATITGPAKVFTGRAGSAFPAAGPGGSPGSNIQIPVPAGSYRLVALVQFTSADAAQAEYDDQCVTAAPTCTLAADGSSGWMLLPGNGGRDSVITGTSTSPETVDPGSHAVFDRLTAGLAASGTAMALAFG